MVRAATSSSRGAGPRRPTTRRAPTPTARSGRRRPGRQRRRPGGAARAARDAGAVRPPGCASAAPGADHAGAPAESSRRSPHGRRRVVASGGAGTFTVQDGCSRSPSAARCGCGSPGCSRSAARRARGRGEAVPRAHDRHAVRRGRRPHPPGERRGASSLRRAGDRCLTALELGGEAAYFREDVVFGLDAAIAFENGRVPSSAGELNLVHLRGAGALLLATAACPSPSTWRRARRCGSRSRRSSAGSARSRRGSDRSSTTRTTRRVAVGSSGQGRGARRPRRPWRSGGPP